MRRKLLDFLVARQETFNIHYTPISTVSSYDFRSPVARLFAILIVGLAVWLLSLPH